MKRRALVLPGRRTAGEGERVDAMLRLRAWGSWCVCVCVCELVCVCGGGVSAWRLCARVALRNVHVNFHTARLTLARALAYGPS